MPTNLPPEYFEIEKEYRAAKSNEEKIALLEELLSVIPKHKGTDHLRADLRRRLSKLKAASQSGKSSGKQASIYRIDREGAGQVVVIGPPNVGKSALVAALTNVSPEVADYPYTTRIPIPGMMPVEDIRVQLIDTPSLNKDFAEPALLDLIRRSDLVLLVIDLQADPIQQLEDTIALLEKNRIVPAHRQDRYTGLRRPTILPVLVVVNKDDDESWDGDFEALQELLGNEWSMIPVSAATGRNFDALKRAVFEGLGIIRIYSKPPGKEPDLSAPFVMKKGSTVEEFAGNVHQDFVKNLKSARVWGSAQYDGQMVSRDYVLQDGDIVELRM